MEKTLVVNRNEFHKNFITPIAKFLDEKDYAGFTFENGLLCFSKPINTVDYKFYYRNRIRPDQSDMDDGEQFFLLDIKKLQKILSIMKDEKVVLKVSKSSLTVISSDTKFRLRLHDEEMAKRRQKGNKKVLEVLDNLSHHVKIEKGVTKKIKNSLMLIDPKNSVSILNKNGDLVLTSGGKTDNQFSCKIGNNKDFVEAEIDQGVFRSIGDAEVDVCHTSLTNRPVLVFREVIDNTERVYITAFV